MKDHRNVRCHTIEELYIRNALSCFGSVFKIPELENVFLKSLNCLEFPGALEYPGVCFERYIVYLNNKLESYFERLISHKVIKTNNLEYCS